MHKQNHTVEKPKVKSIDYNLMEIFHLFWSHKTMNIWKHASTAVKIPISPNTPGNSEYY